MFNSEQNAAYPDPLQLRLRPLRSPLIEERDPEKWHTLVNEINRSLMKKKPA
jgi:hypothetical protein